MKEMCRNFICNNNPESDSPLSDMNVADCSSCVINHIGLAQAYIPSQPYTPPINEEQSLICGTVFSELVMPYCAGWNLYRFSKEA